MEISAELPLSPNAVAERVRRLVQAGIVTGFSATVDPAVLGLHLGAFVDVKLRSDAGADEFERRIAEVPGIIGCTLTTGQFDYTLRVACRDQADLVRIVEFLRTKAGATETYSRIILRDRRFPITAADRRP